MLAFLLSIPAIVWLLISGFLNTFSEYISKHWANNHDWRLILAIALTSTLSSITWLPALLHKNQISIMFTGWLLITTVTTLIVALVIFHEHLSVQQWVGIALAVVALVLLGI